MELGTRIDLLSSLSGIEGFEQAWQQREDGSYGSVYTHYLSLDDLISAKRSADPDQDRARPRASPAGEESALRSVAKDSDKHQEIEAHE